MTFVIKLIILPVLKAMTNDNPVITHTTTTTTTTTTTHNTYAYIIIR